MLLVAGVAQKSSLRSAPASSLSSSTGAARRSTSPFRRRRSEEKKAAGDDQPSSAPAIDPSDASVVAASYTSAGAMDNIKRRLRIAVSEDADMEITAVEVCGCEVGEIDSKELSEVWLGMEDVILSQVSLALAVLEEQEEAEEGERGGKEGEEEGEEKGGDGNEEKGGYPAAH
ncbi:uncharacterized protein MONOS_5612 [Monocercomonoides exilis]|uniref:uncharacterized protein n=1 Tax=Monocercomonoides exilis TaxID=2049356 RepID=UPI003559B70A|nr:hypothetical protein MONOS_5612 [Monocercomonoides exilis]|eukprot:MONOS_5612.1-p1 / transcript=MONOS_5612.1 / gene=MONOS_5612 / organism=Monocercomonoides_exilis_PA203 / gene_product=unspecified product / transcript_product=unspecified product / location=Mono_scaffold00165:49046-49823(-) / protein_length=173 / sequence_SO=supercontig / SO=protein_coding / is_pseudo=false